MMHLTDINHDIARGHIHGIENAFKALVGWPKEGVIHGATPNALKRALKAACEALQRDRNVMPRQTHALIADAVAWPIGDTYADGATAVLDRFTYWTAQLEIRRAA